MLGPGPALPPAEHCRLCVAATASSCCLMSAGRRRGRAGGGPAEVASAKGAPPPVQLVWRMELSWLWRWEVRSLKRRRLASSPSTHLPCPGHSQAHTWQRSWVRQSATCAGPSAAIVALSSLQMGQFLQGGAISRHWHLRSCMRAPLASVRVDRPSRTVYVWAQRGRGSGSAVPRFSRGAGPGARACSRLLSVARVWRCATSAATTDCRQAALLAGAGYRLCATRAAMRAWSSCCWRGLATGYAPRVQRCVVPGLQDSVGGGRGGGEVLVPHLRIDLRLGGHAIAGGRAAGHRWSETSGSYSV